MQPPKESAAASPCKCSRSPASLEYACEYCPRLTDDERAEWRRLHGFAVAKSNIDTAVERTAARWLLRWLQSWWFTFELMLDREARADLAAAEAEDTST